MNTKYQRARSIKYLLILMVGFIVCLGSVLECSYDSSYMDEQPVHKPASVPSSKKKVSQRQVMTNEGPATFRGIPWFAKKENIRGLHFIKHDEDEMVNIYVRRGERLTLDNIKLTRVEYWFDDGRFQAGVIKAKGKKNYEEIKKIMLKELGPGSCEDSGESASKLPRIPGHEWPSRMCSWELRRANVLLYYYKSNGSIELTIMGEGVKYPDDRLTY